jgi:hypothetical protein
MKVAFTIDITSLSNHSGLRFSLLKTCRETHATIIGTFAFSGIKD